MWINKNPSENTYSPKVCDLFDNIGTNHLSASLALSVSRLSGRAFSGLADSRLQSRVYIRLSAAYTWSLFRVPQYKRAVNANKSSLSFLDEGPIE